jgi:predicted flap endonuclease-1-like 5' DNA nuclease
MTKLSDIEGIGAVYQQKLIAAGIKSTEELLDKGSTPKGRKEIAEKSGIGEGLILQWVNHVDLYRIKGVGSEYADLLEAAGVDTIPELANRNPEHLLEKMASTNLEKKLVRRLPVLSQVINWIEQAKTLPRVIHY